LQRNRYVWFAVTVLCCVLARRASAQATPANITVASGSGQLICTNCAPNGVGGVFFWDPVQVRVTDASGNPIANTIVTWTLAAGNAGLLTTQTFTDNNGISQNQLSPAATIGSFGQPFIQNTLVASAGNVSTNVYLTQAFADPFFFNPFVSAQLVTPSSGAQFNGTSGAQSSTPIQVQLFSVVNVPNISISLQNTVDPATGPSVSCANSGPGAEPGTVLTNATGLGTCTPIFGPIPGSGQFYILVGGVRNSIITGSGAIYYARYGPFQFTAAPGQPGLIQVTSTNPQSADPGKSVTVSAKVSDTTGNALGGQYVVWKVTQGAATTTSGSTITDANGQTTNAITLGNNATGQIKVTATVNNTNLAATFTVNANVIVNVTGLSIVSGNNQTAAVNTSFSQPLVVQVNGSNGQGLAGALVQFNASGPVGLSSSPVTTGSDGKASVTATASGSTGNATVTASVGGFSQTFNLTVATPPPPITVNSFYNGASFVQGSLSPCSIATIIAPGLAPGVQGSVSGGGIIGPLPYQVVNNRVTVGNTAAPIYSVSNTGGQEQLTFQVPCDAPAGGTASVVVTTAGGGTASVNLPIQVVSPGIFVTVSSDSVQRIVAVRPDGSFVTPDNPARRSEIIRVYATGLGSTVPAVATNAIPVPGVDATVQGTVVAGITNQGGQGEGLRVTGARAAANLIGVFEVPVQIPSDAATGSNVSFSIAVIPVGTNTPVYSQTVKIPVL
jgi:uncharacterized protein (TIGR03437 family)